MIPPPPPSDVAFLEIVEEFVAQRGPVPYPQLREVVGHRDAALLRLLAFPDYEVRKIARQNLGAEQSSAWRALTWGAWSRDPEVRRVCRELREAYPCRRCGGGGVARQTPGSSQVTGLCPDCGGSGRVGHSR